MDIFIIYQYATTNLWLSLKPWMGNEDCLRECREEHLMEGSEMSQKQLFFLLSFRNVWWKKD